MEMTDISSYKGKKNVVLYFYPRDGTPGCTIQAIGFSDRENEFNKLDTIKADNAWTVEQQRSICEIAAPPFKEAARGREMKRRFLALGYKNVVIDSVGNVIVERKGNGSWPTLVIAGHLDTMFPEGTRARKGLVKKFEHRARTGSARIALAAGVPLVPAAISGTDRLLRFPRLKVAYGKPVQLDDLEGQTPREAAQVATERLMAAIYELRDAL